MDLATKVALAVQRGAAAAAATVLEAAATAEAAEETELAVGATASVEGATEAAVVWGERESWEGWADGSAETAVGRCQRRQGRGFAGLEEEAV